MHLQLDGRGPLHAQLTRALKSALANGRVGEGSRLPPTRALARDLGLSRNTVLTAYEQLRAEGFMDARVGSGSYVSAPLLAEAANDPPPRVAEPQTAYARRSREIHSLATLGTRRKVQGIRWSFQYGLPLVNPALTTAWARELARAAAYTTPNYPDPQGLPALREAICDYLARRRGVQATPDDVLIVSGTQQAVSLSARVLLEEGELAVVEEPQYFALRQILQMHGARVQGTGVDTDGLCVDQLPSASPRLICVTPSHQFPSGAVMSLPRRLELLQYARQHHSWILEDDYDGEFRYDSKPLAALRSLDRDGRVLYVGTFSKTLFPSLRLGYIVMPATLQQDLVTAKWAQDFGSSAIEQAALAHFMTEGGFERHLRRSTRTLQERRAALLDGLREIGAGRIDIADSHAGMHLVVWLRDKTHADLDSLLAHAHQLGLGLYSIRPHYLQPPDRAGLLMGYCGLSVSEINEALPLFARVLDQAYR
ncbi:GntR family transcriptional regulator [Lysobacter helvus]|uniref:GntR family transcriptional regulator n=2 Tax=Lysobacteraceae TaxID=32033 RepID=A0ABM7Q2X0_9GAMM|nr:MULTISPECIES: PLP-dependent aminotransferase family protein [Lysobacter]BCT91515.1 GntR family transcriptional regulator [Lysobacter caseinilyticus]BCT94668.1 GntR family transcriptional regulator [Lysobacter helvus]